MFKFRTANDYELIVKTNNDESCVQIGSHGGVIDIPNTLASAIAEAILHVADSNTTDLELLSGLYREKKSAGRK